MDSDYQPAAQYFRDIFRLSSAEAMANAFELEAKRRNKQLKKLRSVSKDYRKRQVAEIKAKAAAERREADRQQAVQASNQHQADMLNAAAAMQGTKNYYGTGIARGVFGSWW